MPRPASRLHAALVVGEHVSEQQERRGHVEQGGERISQGAIGARQVRPAGAKDENARDGQHIEKVGSEDHIGVEQVVKRSRVQLRPGVPDRPGQAAFGAGAAGQRSKSSAATVRMMAQIPCARIALAGV